LQTHKLLAKRVTLFQSLLDFQERSGQAQEHSASVFFHTFPLSKKFGAQKGFELKQGQLFYQVWAASISLL
jgi:hypothetical protein